MSCDLYKSTQIFTLQVTLGSLRTTDDSSHNSPNYNMFLGKPLNLEQENSDFQYYFETNALYDLRNDSIAVRGNPLLFLL